MQNTSGCQHLIHDEVGDQREGRRVASRKAVAAEAFKLAKGSLGEVLLIATRGHAVDKLRLAGTDAAGELEGRHRAALLVRRSGFSRLLSTIRARTSRYMTHPASIVRTSDSPSPTDVIAIAFLPPTMPSREVFPAC